MANIVGYTTQFSGGEQVQVPVTEDQMMQWWNSIPGSTPEEKYAATDPSGNRYISMSPIGGSIETSQALSQLGLVSGQQIQSDPVVQQAQAQAGPSGLTQLGSLGFDLGTMAMLGGAGYAGLGALGGLGGTEALGTVAPYGGFDAAAVAGADYGGLAGLGAAAPGVEVGTWGGAQPVGDGTFMVNPSQGGPIQTLPDMMLGGGEVMAGPGAVDLTAGGLGGLGGAGLAGAAGAGAIGAGAAGGGAVGGLGAGSAAIGGTEAMAAGALGGEALGGGGGGYSGSPTGGGGGFGGALMPQDDWWKYLLPGIPGLVGALGAGSIAEDMEDQAHAYQQMGAPYRSRLESLYTPQGIQAFMQSPEVQVPVQQGTDMLARSLSVKGNPAGSGNALQELQNYSTNQLYSRLGQERDRLGGFGGLTAYNQAAPQAATNAMAMTNNMYGNLGGAAADIFNPQRRYTLEDFSRMFS